MSTLTLVRCLARQFLYKLNNLLIVLIMRPKGLVNKRITKGCPQCTLQVPTACKTCTCGFLFKRNVPPAQPVTNVDSTNRRRTGRVKKEPNYFNTMEYDHHFKRKHKTISGEEVTKKKKPKAKPVIAKDDTSDSKEGHASSNCDTPQGKDDQERVKEELQDAYINLTPEKNLQYAIILAEINRKFLGQNFQPS